MASTADDAAASVLITGGGTGIGAAVARRMADGGYTVSVTGRRPEPVSGVAAAIGGLALSGDSSRPEDTERVVAACVKRFGRLDALVVSAGTGSPGTVGEQTLEGWNHVLATNMTAPFLICRAALPLWSRPAGRSSRSLRWPGCGPIRPRRRTARRRPGS